MMISSEREQRTKRTNVALPSTHRRLREHTQTSKVSCDIHFSCTSFKGGLPRTRATPRARCHSYRSSTFYREVHLRPTLN